MKKCDYIKTCLIKFISLYLSTMVYNKFYNKIHLLLYLYYQKFINSILLHMILL